MRKTLVLFVALACLIFCPTFGSGRDLDLPLRFAPNVHDRGLVQVHNPTDGRTWSAWAYRNGAEFDVAISVADRDGFWSEPRLVGLDDGSDQIDPALAVDTRGTVYLAFVDRASDVIVVTALRAGAQAWSTPTAVSDPRIHGRSPSLAVIGNRLVVGFRSGAEVRISDIPLLPPTLPPNTTQGINDGPDPSGVVDDDANSGQSGGDIPPPIPLPRDDGDSN